MLTYSLLSSVGIFMVRAKTGMEQTLVKAILLKSIDRQRKGQK